MLSIFWIMACGAIIWARLDSTNPIDGILLLSPLLLAVSILLALVLPVWHLGRYEGWITQRRLQSAASPREKFFGQSRSSFVGARTDSMRNVARYRPVDSSRTLAVPAIILCLALITSILIPLIVSLSKIWAGIFSDDTATDVTARHLRNIIRAGRAKESGRRRLLHLDLLPLFSQNHPRFHCDFAAPSRSPVPTSTDYVTRCDLTRRLTPHPLPPRSPIYHRPKTEIKKSIQRLYETLSERIRSRSRRQIIPRRECTEAE